MYVKNKATRVNDQCGCFFGTAEELIRYIEDGDQRLKATRTRAFEVVTELIEMRN